MPFVTHAGARLYWRADGDPALPPLVLVNSLGTDHCLWDPVMPRLADFFRVIRMDMRGHGASDAPAGEYTVELLARDVLAVADAAGLETFDCCGISLGGIMGSVITAMSPDLKASVLNVAGATRLALRYCSAAFAYCFLL
jgi:3-oxoadipate enol-lactonase/4-carboxymuconolactone decarboxylase